MAQPNIVLILMDDLGWADLGCFGSSFYETPNLDALAKQGMRFSDAYASAPVSSPTRASIYTGQVPARVGITNWLHGNPWGPLMGAPYVHELPRDAITFPRILQQAGYNTWHVGKWHLGRLEHSPTDFGFDVNIGGNHWGAPKNGYFSPYDMPNLENGPDGEYLTDRLTDEAMRLVEASEGQPYFLAMSHYAVHTPIQAPEPLVEKYRRKAADMGIADIDPFAYGPNHKALHKADKPIVRRKLQSDPVYAAMVENMDTNIGRLIRTIESMPNGENTLIFFTSDNGGLATAEGSPTCNAPLIEGKGWMYDGGVRAPAIVRWPGKVRPGSECDEPISSQDIMPTFLEAAGAVTPNLLMDGVSLMPLLQGELTLPREALFWHYPHYSNQGGDPACAIRCGPMKLIEFFEDHHLELYHLGEDIGEQHDRSADLPDITQQMHEQLKAWRGEVNASMPQPNPDYAAMLAGDMPRPNGDGILPE